MGLLIGLLIPRNRLFWEGNPTVLARRTTPRPAALAVPAPLILLYRLLLLPLLLAHTVPAEDLHFLFLPLHSTSKLRLCKHTSYNSGRSRPYPLSLLHTFIPPRKTRRNEHPIPTL